MREVSESRAESPQKGLEERYRILTQVAFDGICVHKDGKFVEANDLFAAMAGYPLEEIIGMPVEAVIPLEERADVHERMRSQDSKRYESRFLRRDGTSFPIEVAGGSLPGGERVAAIRDISGRRESEDAVLAREELFRSIIENSPDLIAILEPSGKFRYHSPSIGRILGIPSDSVPGRSFLDFVHPDDVGRATEFMQQQIADPAANGMVELRLRHQNGSWRSFEVGARNLTTAGLVSATVTNARDITDRTMLESQLAQANRLNSLGRLAATVAHEFNNVLMGMQPFAELLQRAELPPAMIGKCAWQIANSIQRGKRIALDILRFTQPPESVVALVDVGEWWEKFEPEVEILLGNSVRLVAHIDPRGTCVVADEEQLSQVMANLVANARDAMPAGGTLTVRACQPPAGAVFPFGVVPNAEHFIELAVSDTGQGMSAEVTQHVFEPLFTTKKSGGTGLGLAVAHQVLTQHGGHIFVESEVGRGTTFHLFFPVGVHPCSEAPAVPDEPRMAQVRRVLMVEDEQNIVEGITALLECEGMSVAAVGTGGEAAAAVARFQPDVVVLDFGLPDMDGSQVYKVLRGLYPLLPVIFATGHGDRRAIHDGMDDVRTRFLQKPFEIGTLLSMIAEVRPEDGRDG